MGHGIEQIETTKIPQAVLFHPTSQDTIVLVSSQEMESEDADHVFVIRLIAEECTNGNLQQTSFIDIPFLLDRPRDNPQVDIRPVDHNSVYSVG